MTHLRGALFYGLLTALLGLGSFARATASPLPQTAALDVSAVSATSGYAGHSVVLTGGNFGAVAGRVTWGDEPCTITSWEPSSITAYLPDDARPATRGLVVRAAGGESQPIPFTVTPPEFEPSRVMIDAYTFMRDRMRNPEGGVYTEFVDRADPDLVYLYGHHVTAEHMGLMLWVAAAMLDHKTFEESYQFVAQKMISPRFGVVNWGVDKTTGQAFLSADDTTGARTQHNNAPMDDLRVARGLISGWLQWEDDRYRDAALQIGRGLLATSLTASEDFPEYPEGLITEGFMWNEETGRGEVEADVIPVNYADLWTMRWLSQVDPRWNGPIAASIRLMEKAQIPSSGQFWNAYVEETSSFSGDWEYHGELRGQKIKSIQSLWTALHLARVGRTAPAQRALDFYRRQYETNGRVSEYYNPDGSDPTEPEIVATLVQGEARIYAFVAELAYLLGDRAFGDRVLAEKIERDQDRAATSPTFGSLGVTGAGGPGNASAYDTLEALVALAAQKNSSVVTQTFGG
jgi:hypothetical protein